MRRILLASMNVGGGHAALADSFATALRLADPDGRRFAPIRYDSKDTSLESFYSWVVHHATRLQGGIYRLSNTDWGLLAATSFAPGLMRECKAVLRESGADAVISTHPILSMVLSRARHALGATARIISAIPDYGTPTRGFYPSHPRLQPDAAIVMDEQTRTHLIRSFGAPADRVHLSGFLPRAPFRERAGQLAPRGRLRGPQREALRHELAAAAPELARLRADRTTVLAMGGSAWTRKTLPVLRELAAHPLFSHLQLAVVCGRDEGFREQLAAEMGGRDNVSVLGFMDGKVLSGLMAYADFPLLGSLAPATLNELLELRCGPLLLSHFIPGTEAPHVPYLRNHRLGLYEPDPAQMAAKILQLAHLTPAGEEIQELQAAFADRAAALRSASRERALALGGFLDTLPPLGLPFPADLGAPQPRYAS